MFGDKDATIQRFKEVYTTRLSDDIKARLVLENDEVRLDFDFLRNKSVTCKRSQMCYNADDLLPVCEELNIPIVVSRPPAAPTASHSDTTPQFDYHHNWIFVSLANEHASACTHSQNPCSRRYSPSPS